MARRVLAPDDKVAQAEVRGPGGVTRRYSPSGGGIYTVSDADARVLRQEGFAEASLSGTTSPGLGRRCTSCGFGSYFTTCSRCGGTCEKE